jgi:serine acetyltransferase
VVITDVPSNCIAVGVPAKIRPRKLSTPPDTIPPEGPQLGVLPPEE